MTTVSLPTDPLSLRSLAAPGLAAVRRFWRPFLLLQSAALGLVLLYFGHDAVRGACDGLARLKQTSGPLFVAGAAAFAGAILPELARQMLPAERRIDSRRLKDIGFNVLAFGYNGLVTDYFYRLLAVVLGEETSAGNVISKMLIDQFLLTPVYFIPFWALIYGWKGNHFALARTFGELRTNWYRRRVVVLLLPCWAYWIPMTLLVYSLPTPLQFCLFLLAGAAWALVMVFVATGRGDPAVPPDRSIAPRA